MTKTLDQMTEKEINALMLSNRRAQKERANSDHGQVKKALLDIGFGLPRLKKLINGGCLPESKDFMEREEVNFNDHCLWRRCQKEIDYMGMLEASCLPFSNLSCRP